MAITAGVALLAAACQPDGGSQGRTGGVISPQRPTTTAKRTTTTVKRTTTTVSTTTTAPPPTTVGPGGELPWPATWPDPAAWHVAKRLTYGPTPSLVASIAKSGTTAWIDAQLKHTAIDDSAVDALTAVYPYSRGTALETVTRGEVWRVPWELMAATTVRATCAKRQLFEMVVSFWWDHLNVDANLESAQPHCPSYDANVIRAHALGRFSNLLAASARSGAMLNYLDQATSRADKGRVPNENYARELMELHTVGVDGGYTEDDVKAVAHLLSGWSLTHYSEGTFLFKAVWHDPGPFADPARTVLGWRPQGLTGEAAGVSFLNHLARHPATARRIAHKLAVRFIGEHVKSTDAVVTAAANAYTANDTAIAPTLRVLLTSAEFKGSADRRIRRPHELLAAALRATAGTTWTNTKPDSLMWNINWIAGPLANLPHHWPAPNGYPDADGKWASVGALIGRWNLATHVATGGVPGFTIDWANLHTWTKGTTLGEWFQAAAARTGVNLDEATRTRMLADAGRTPGSPIRPDKDKWVFARILTYLLQSPQFQVR